MLETAESGGCIDIKIAVSYNEGDLTSSRSFSQVQIIKCRFIGCDFGGNTFYNVKFADYKGEGGFFRTPLKGMDLSDK